MMENFPTTFVKPLYLYHKFLIFVIDGSGFEAKPTAETGSPYAKIEVYKFSSVTKITRRPILVEFPLGASPMS